MLKGAIYLSILIALLIGAAFGTAFSTAYAASPNCEALFQAEAKVDLVEMVALPDALAVQDFDKIGINLRSSPPEVSRKISKLESAEFDEALETLLRLETTSQDVSN
jgi:hypothetical protein